MSNLERQFQSENLLIQKELAKSKQANNKEKLFINQLQRLNNTERQLLWREAQTQASVEEAKDLMKFMVSRVRERWETERMMKMEYKIKANEARRAMGLSDNASIEELAIARARHSAMLHNRETNVLNLDMPAIAERARLRKENNEQKRLEEIVKFKEKEQVTQLEHITRAINKCLFCYLTNNS
uniref:Uncharacterized protein n=1 Tax=viral metagenome TaxID=1070528 RepID=A0A6C0D527_9ZZZZ